MAEAMRKPGDCTFEARKPAVHNEFLIQKGALRSDPSKLVWMVSPATAAPREQKAALLDNAKTLRDVNAVNVAQVLGFGAKDGHENNGYVILSRQPVTLADIWAERAASPAPGSEAMQADTRTLCRALGDLLQGMAFLHEQGIILGSLDPSMVEMSADMQTVHIVCLPLVPLNKGRMLRWCPACRFTFRPYKRRPATSLQRRRFPKSNGCGTALVCRNSTGNGGSAEADLPNNNRRVRNEL